MTAKNGIAPNDQNWSGPSYNVFLSAIGMPTSHRDTLSRYAWELREAIAHEAVQMVKAPSRHTLINPGTSDFESWRPLGAALDEQTTELPESHLA
ncbi:hypothetical protein O9K51_02305 [Purpureocillium lavendulum]|uniref:Uncharacterized protein n=1 Tax=Purpureocillium lavendulum TaxID=1247861 RepID=A0AB34FYN6_9HYPO|nr:hypothetical protein O9K51_02305 [Purpureocillium lavendulum]